MFWFVLAALVLWLLYARGWRLTVMCLLATVVSLLLVIFAFALGGLMLFLYDPEVVRIWTLPEFWVTRLVDGDTSLLAILSWAPVLFVGDIVRAIGHILLAHPHPVLWLWMLVGAVPIASMWKTAFKAMAVRP